MTTMLINEPAAAPKRTAPPAAERRLYAGGVLLLAAHLVVTALAGPATSIAGIAVIGLLTAVAAAE